MGTGSSETGNRFGSKKGSGSRDVGGGPVYGAGAKSAGSMADSTSKGASKMLSGGNQG